ncbi:MAG: cytochrome c [Alphaproteobacteria bacterium]|nr:cytochrome c [Alphaproteobacteria bacterium]
MRVVVASAVLALTVFVSAACGSSAQTPQQVVDARIEAMKKFGGTLKATSQAATPAEAKAKIADAIAFSESIVSRFPKGTGIGDAGVTKTRALQDIWAKPAEFKAAADAMTATLKSIDAALGGDKAAVDAAFAEVGKNCGGCHKPFRGPEVSE